MKLKIGEKELSVKVADTDEKRTRGLLDIKAGSMPKSAGLVLKYNQATPANITMVGMKFPIDIIFVKDNKVQKVVPAEPGKESITINDVSDYVIEVPKGSGDDVKVGDLIDWVGEKKEDGTIEMAEGGVVAAADGAMKVLDENGKVQGNIQGDERIFSRKHTARLLELADLASTSKSNNDYKKLGMAMMRMIDKQDTQEQEYVKE
jgi:uncharacterized membrane protein (UPF0127 family)